MSILKNNQYYSQSFFFTQNDVIKFAEVSGDTNPIHLDEKYASKSVFGKRIVHGFLSASIFSKVLGTSFPGKGTIYIKQNLIFIRPLFVQNIYTATFKVMSTFPKKKRAEIRTEIIDKKETVMITGSALIQHPLL